MNSNNSKDKEEVGANQVNSKDKFENIKTDYFLILLFSNLDKQKALKIVKYNKNIMKRINININDYKEYSTIYSPIEIEIKPVINKYGQFINIEKDVKNYYHIYFDNNKEEIKREYINEIEEIKIIKIIIDYQIKSFDCLFSYCDCIESINFKKFNRKIEYMDHMFSECSSLKELNFNNYNFYKVKYMYKMFSGCSNELIMKIKAQYKNIRKEAFDN